MSYSTSTEVAPPKSPTHESYEDTDEGKPKRRLLKLGVGVGAVALLAGGAVAGYVVGEDSGKKEANTAAYDSGVRDGSNACINGLKTVEVQRIDLKADQVRSFTNLISSPGVPHADSAELDGLGYTPIQRGLDSGLRVLDFDVQLDVNNPPADAKETKSLTAQANLLSTLIHLQMADDDLIQSTTTVPVAQLDPAKALTIVEYKLAC
jgi:hypothetical protein